MSKCRALSYTLGSGIFFPFIVRRVLPSVQYSSVFLFRTSPIPDRIAPEQKTTKKDNSSQRPSPENDDLIEHCTNGGFSKLIHTLLTERDTHPTTKKKVPERPPPLSLWAFLHRPSLVSERPSAYPSVRVSRRISNNCWIDKHFFFFFSSGCHSCSLLLSRSDGHREDQKPPATATTTTDSAARRKIAASVTTACRASSNFMSISP